MFAEFQGDYPINVLKKAGVDMSTPKPLEDTIKKFDELLEMLEKEIYGKGRFLCHIEEY